MSFTDCPDCHGTGIVGVDPGILESTAILNALSLVTLVLHSIADTPDTAPLPIEDINAVLRDTPPMHLVEHVRQLAIIGGLAICQLLPPSADPCAWWAEWAAATAARNSH